MVTGTLAVAKSAIVAVVSARVVRCTIEVFHRVLMRVFEKMLISGLNRRYGLTLVLEVTYAAVIVVAASIAVKSLFSVLNGCTANIADGN